MFQLIITTLDADYDDPLTFTEDHQTQDLAEMQGMRYLTLGEPYFEVWTLSEDGELIECVTQQGA